MKSNCVSLIKKIIELHLYYKRVEIFVEHTYSIEFVLIFRVLFWLAQQRNVESFFFKRRFLHIFCSELLLFVKKPTGMGF